MNVYNHIQSLAIMITLFLIATNFDSKQSNMNRHKKTICIDKFMTDPLEYVLVRDASLQAPHSKYVISYVYMSILSSYIFVFNFLRLFYFNDCGMYSCVFVEFINYDVFDFSTIKFNAFNSRIRYGALFQIMLKESEMRVQLVKIKWLRMLRTDSVVQRFWVRLLWMFKNFNMPLKKYNDIVVIYGYYIWLLFLEMDIFIDSFLCSVILSLKQSYYESIFFYFGI